jgi:hypothetical protein
MNKKIIGYVFLSLACCIWILPLIIGFISLTATYRAILLTAVVVLGEVFFVLSIVFLGKEFMVKIKYYVIVRRRYVKRKLNKL